MNLIEKTIYSMGALLRETGLENESKIKELEQLKQNLIEESYNKGLVKNLVDIMNLSENIINIGDLEWGEDYEILTKTYRDEDGNEFDTEEEYNGYIRDKVEEQIIEYQIERDEEYEGMYIIINDEGDILDEEFETVEDARMRIEEMKEELIEDCPTFDELDYEYDEIYYNYVYGYEYIDIDLAKQCGLGVLELNNTGEQYLFLQGCGMDMSFQFVRYQALYFGAISERFLDKLGWTKTNYDEETFNEILESLGVDTEKLKKH